MIYDIILILLFDKNSKISFSPNKIFRFDTNIILLIAHIRIVCKCKLFFAFLSKAARIIKLKS